VAPVAGSEDVSNDVCHGETGKVGDLPVEQSRFPFAPLPRKIVAIHPRFH
jgi:hypothetical protein